MPVDAPNDDRLHSKIPLGSQPSPRLFRWQVKQTRGQSKVDCAHQRDALARLAPAIRGTSDDAPRAALKNVHPYFTGVLILTAGVGGVGLA